MPKTIKVTVTVNLDGQECTFTTEASTDGDVFDVARGNVRGVTDSAHSWIHEQEQAAKYPGIVARRLAHQNA